MHSAVFFIAYLCCFTFVLHVKCMRKGKKKLDRNHSFLFSSAVRSIVIYMWDECGWVRILLPHPQTYTHSRAKIEDYF